MREQLQKAIQDNDAERRRVNGAFIARERELRADLEALERGPLSPVLPVARTLELEPVSKHSELVELGPTSPVEVMAAIAALEREDDVYALVRKWGKQGNVAALEAIAENSMHTPLVAYVERLLAKLEPAAAPEAEAAPATENA